MDAKTLAFPLEAIRAAVEEGESDLLRLVERGEWIDDGKYQYQEIILVDLTGKHFCYTLSKSGSYFAEVTYGWEYESDYVELAEVEKATRTVEYWKVIEAA